MNRCHVDTDRKGMSFPSDVSIHWAKNWKCRPTRGCQESKYYFEKAIMKQGHNPHSPAPVEWIGAVQGHDGFR